LSYAPSDPGQPGLFWAGLANQAQQQAWYLDQSTTWGQYQGGLYVPQGIYRGGLPSVINISFPFPTIVGNSMTTGPFAGWSLLVGHGVLTPSAQNLVAARRQSLDAAKPQRVAAGKWNPDYDSDERFMWSLVQKNMVDNNKYQAVAMVSAQQPSVSSTTVPFIDCTPPSSH
jgi:hypothetical protein